jgi:hypothetical protein
MTYSVVIQITPGLYVIPGKVFEAGRLLERLFSGREVAYSITQGVDPAAGSGASFIMTSLTFEDADDAMLFKLAWGGA